MIITIILWGGFLNYLFHVLRLNRRKRKDVFVFQIKWCFSLLLSCCDKTFDQKQVMSGKGIFGSQVMVHHQVRSGKGLRVGTWRKELKRWHGRMQYCFPWLAQLPTSCPVMVTPKWARPLHQWENNKMPSKVCPQANLTEAFLLVSLFHGCLGWYQGEENDDKRVSERHVSIIILSKQQWKLLTFDSYFQHGMLS